MAMLSNICRT